ncbi:MAG TPA: hypothetical protein VIV06_10720 [Candidatus Limnocylindrales bacterium]
MDSALVLPLLAFVALAGIFVFVLRRTGRVIAGTRDAEHFRRAVDDLAQRIDISLGGVVERIDGVRRRQLAPDVIADNLAAALDAVGRYLTEAHDLRAPASAAELRGGFEAEIERADRALRMVEHGCAILRTSRGFGRDVEGETAVKRGYLNLLHAREAIAEYAVEIRTSRAGTEPRWFSRRDNA